MSLPFGKVAQVRGILVRVVPKQTLLLGPQSKVGPARTIDSRQSAQACEIFREERAFRYLYPLRACSVDTFGRAEIISGVALRTCTLGEGTVTL
jgi:hypothetical protein